MSSVEGRADSELMPDWNGYEAVRVDRVNWDQIVERGKPPETTLHAAHTEES